MNSAMEITYEKFSVLFIGTHEAIIVFLHCIIRVFKSLNLTLAFVLIHSSKAQMD